MTLVVMASGPVDNNTWRTFDFADVKRFAWDACREVAVNETYTEPWTFQEFLTVSKREAYKSHKKTTLDLFSNKNNIYRTFIEEIIKEVVHWRFFTKSNDATEMDEVNALVVIDSLFSPILFYFNIEIDAKVVENNIKIYEGDNLRELFSNLKNRL
jgi:hypothetical protein